MHASLHAALALLRRAGRAAGSEALACDLALLIERAKCAGFPLSGIAIDWSKAYDRIPLAYLRVLAVEAGVPDELAGPMLAAYGAPRQVKVGGLAAPPATPSHGIPPGCPAATHWMALAVFGFLRRVEHMVGGAMGREYVGDLLAWLCELVECTPVT